MHVQNLNTAREHVSILKSSLKYNFNSFEMREPKSCGCVLFISYNVTLESLKKHSSQHECGKMVWSCFYDFMFQSEMLSFDPLI